MCSCGQPKTPITQNPSSLMSSSGNFTTESLGLVADPTNKSQMVVIEYSGPIKEPFSIRSRMNKQITYRFANSDQHRTKAVLLGDAEFLIGLVGREGPEYVIVSAVGVENANDPTLFLGQPIAA